MSLLCLQAVQALDWQRLRQQVFSPLHRAVQAALDQLQRAGDSSLVFEAKQAASCVLVNVQWLLDEQ